MLKVLAYGDAGQNTGFERVYRGILTHLHNTGRFEVTGFGLGYNGNPDFTYPFKVYPANYRGDYFGVEYLEEACKRHKPDVVWGVQDVWNHLQYVVQQPIEIPYVGYFPIDTPNLKWSHALAFGGMAQPVAYTRYGAHEAAAAVRHALDIIVEGAVLKDLSLAEPRQWVALPHPETSKKLQLRLDYLNRWQNLENWPVIPHGLDKQGFHPLNKQDARREFDLKDDEFLIGCVNTNQFRKRLDTAMRIFAAVAQKHPKARLVLYCNSNNEGGLDLHQAAAYLGIEKKCYFVHEHVQDLPTSDLNVLYNCLDVMINTSGGEGWGLTSMEGAAAGVPQLVPNWSATREIWKDNGVLLPVSDWRMEVRHLNTCHAILDVKRSIQLLSELVEDEEKRILWGNRAKDLADRQLSWAEVGGLFEHAIKRAVGLHGPPEPLTLEQMVASRKGVVESELRNVLYFEDGKPVRS